MREQVSRFARLAVLTISLGVSPSMLGAQELEHLIDSVATEWSIAASKSPEDLDHLVRQSAVLRDARIVRATIAAASRPTDPAESRIAALRVLYSFATRDWSADLPKTIPDSVTYIAGHATHRFGVNGSQSVTNELLEELRSAMQPLLADANVRKHAAIVVKAIDIFDEQPVTLTYVCDNQFRIRNFNKVHTYIKYEVDGYAEAEYYVLPPRPANAPFSEATLQTRASGTVRLKDVAEKELAVAGNARIKCPQ